MRAQGVLESAPTSQEGTQAGRRLAPADQRAKWLGTPARAVGPEPSVQQQQAPAGRIPPSPHPSPSVAVVEAREADKAGPSFEYQQVERRGRSAEGQRSSLGPSQPARVASAQAPGASEPAGPVQRVAGLDRARGAPVRVDARGVGLPAPQQQLQPFQAAGTIQPATQASQSRISARQSIAQRQEGEFRDTGAGDGYGGVRPGPSDDGGGAGGSVGASRSRTEAAAQDHLVTVVITLQTTPRPDPSGRPASRP
jgi:hypothetical protein